MCSDIDDQDEVFAESDYTKTPGVEVHDEAKSSIISRFRKQFRSPRVDKLSPPSTPTNAFFYDAIEIDLSILLCHDLVGRRLYLFNETFGSLCIASGKDIWQYLQERNPWEDFDFYVFEDDWHWCLTVTHHGSTHLLGSIGSAGT